jgi:hypothetical protein
VGLEACATIASKLDTRHMNVQRRPVTETVNLTAKADSKESVTTAVGKATKLTTAGRKKETRRRGQSGIRERQQAK